MSQEKKVTEEDNFDVTIKYNKREGGSNCMKGTLLNEEKRDVYNDINEETNYVDRMRGSIFQMNK